MTESCLAFNCPAAFRHRSTPSPLGWKSLLPGCVASCLVAPAALAQTATWVGPVNGSWFTAGNWSPAGVPTTFSNVVFTSGTPTIGANGAQANSVAIGGNTVATVNNADIGGLTTITMNGAGPASPTSSLTGMNFTGASSAGAVTLNVIGADLSNYFDASVRFTNTSTAANATLSVSNQAQIGFFDSATAGNATIVANAGGFTAFTGNSNAGTATITVNAGGLNAFLGDAAADTATIRNNAGGTVDIGKTALSQAGSGALSIGSLSGSGSVYLGDSRLILGNLNQNDLISGVIADGGSPLLNGYYTNSGRPPPIYSGGGSLTKIGSGTLTLTGANTYTGGTAINAGVLSVGADASLGASTGPLSFDGGTLLSTASFSMDRVTTLNAGGGTFETAAGTQLSQSGNISGIGNLTKLGAGTFLLSGSNTYSGDTIVGGGTLAAGAINTFSANSAHSVVPGALLELNGFNQTIGSLDNAGTVHAGGAPGTFLTVSGNYVGSGGTLALNTTLGNDASATDRLVVTGNTSGSTNVRVTNIGGTGAQTVEGIKIVDVTGASNGTFSLLGNYVFQGQQAVIGGAYAYTLQKNGISTPTDGDWYLRSSLQAPTNPAAPLTPSAPLYQPGVPVYEAYPQVLQTLNQLPTLWQRVGDRYDGFIPSRGNTGDTLAPPSPIWARIEAAHGAFSPNVTTSGTNYDVDQWRLQAGLDGEVFRGGSGSLFAGITAHYGTADSNISSVYGNGRIDVAGYGVGSTLTWYGDNGFYVDGQGQLTWFDSDLSSALLGRGLDRGDKGSGYAFGVEVGRKIAIDQHWSLTPQAQLYYSAVDFDSFTDPFGARISLDHGDSLRGRIGLAADYKSTWRDGSGQLANASVYGIANLYNEFLDGSEVTVSETPFANANDRFWGGLGAGGKYDWANGKYSLYGEFAVNSSLTHFGDSYIVTGKAGFRTVF